MVAVIGTGLRDGGSRGVEDDSGRCEDVDVMGGGGAVAGPVEGRGKK